MVVADGVGSLSGSELASRFAVDAFVDAFAEPADFEAVTERLARSLNAANKAIHQLRISQPEYTKAATTLTAAFVETGYVWWISVGDSPLYLVGKNWMKRLNADHSLANSLDSFVRLGLMSKADARSDSSRHQLTSVLSGERLTLVDRPSRGLPLADQQRVLISTDGLSRVADDLVIKMCRYVESSQEVADNLIRLLKEQNLEAQDNATVIVSDRAQRSWRARIVQSATLLKRQFGKVFFRSLKQ